ncbi:MAG TPA: hypothetical protein VFL86_12895, partial [Burkholderiaceae bacterium]|nr:hypothetical protein [Burkholderiaceae bacterium]
SAAADPPPGPRPPAQPSMVPPSLSPGDEAAPGTPGTGEGICPRCGGTGRVDAEPCPDCAGSGHVTMGIGGG